MKSRRRASAKDPIWCALRRVFSESSRQFIRELYLGICDKEWTPCLTAEIISRCTWFFFCCCVSFVARQVGCLSFVLFTNHPAIAPLFAPLRKTLVQLQIEQRWKSKQHTQIGRILNQKTLNRHLPKRQATGDQELPELVSVVFA